MDDFGDFVARLSFARPLPSVFNPYAGMTGETRRANLHRYLVRMAERQPRVLLVGEAPGYRGGRVTGVPFTSEAILLTEPTPFGLFGAAAGFQAAQDGSAPLNEATATILWQTLLAFEMLPLLWNAFPFHAHQPDRLHSNRPPKRAELALGQESVRYLLAHYPIQQVIAVGNKAEDMLAGAGIRATKVRHPSRGGKTAFSRGLAAALLPAKEFPGP